MSTFQRIDLERLHTLGVRTADFGGRWSERHPWSAPGPFYGTTFNTLSLAALSTDTSGLILFDNRGEFLWRQPVTSSEYDQVLTAMSKDEALSYQIDGDSHWNGGLVAEWMRTQLPQLLEWAMHPSTGGYLAANSSGYLDTSGARRRLAEVVRYYRSRGTKDLEDYVRALSDRR